MKSIRLPAIAIVAFGLMTTGTAQAEIGKLRPGLWEIKLDGAKEDIGNEYVSRLEQKLDKLPDFLRDKLQNMIGRQKQFVGGQNKFCISDEQMKTAPVSAMGPRGCTEKVVWDGSSGLGNVYLNCPDGSKGNGQMEIRNARTFGLALRMKGGAAKKGRQVYQGKFLSDDCGSIKPR